MPTRKKLAPTEEALTYQPPSLDESCRFAVDKLLRDHGFTIWSRPTKKERETVWRDTQGKLYRQSVALRTLPPGRVDDAKYVENLYLEEKFT